MKRLTSLKAMLAITTLVLSAGSVMAQDGGKMSPKASSTPKPGASQASLTKAGTGTLVIVAVKRDERMQFARDKSLVMQSMQRALEKSSIRERVSDVSLSVFDKADYLIVKLVDERKMESNLFVDLVPVSEGSAYHTLGPHHVSCANKPDCKKGCWPVQPGKHNNTTNFMTCRCGMDNLDGTESSESCMFKINMVIAKDLFTTFRAELLADGFEEGTGGNPKEIKTVTPRSKKN